MFERPDTSAPGWPGIPARWTSSAKTGVGTAVIAGLAVWFLADLYGGVGLVLMGFFPGGLAAFTLAWGAVEIVIGAIAGAWAYRE